MLPRLHSLRCLSRALASAPRRGVHEYFQYTGAICGTVNDSYPQYSGRFKEPDVPINLKKAEEEHRLYVEQLKKLLPGKVLQNPPDNRFPDQIFIQDPALVYHGIALLGRSNSPPRVCEKYLVKQALEEMGFNEIHEMKRPDAYLDGGDVLFTGREFIVGLSSRTNKASNK